MPECNCNLESRRKEWLSEYEEIRKHEQKIASQEINKVKYQIQDRISRELNELSISLEEPTNENIEIAKLLIQRLQKITKELTS